MPDRHLELTKPLLIMAGAFFVSLGIESLDSAVNILTSIGRALVALTMIITSIYTLFKLKRDHVKQDNKRKNKGDN